MQKRLIVLRSLLIVATPYPKSETLNPESLLRISSITSAQGLRVCGTDNEAPNDVSDPAFFVFLKCKK